MLKNLFGGKKKEFFVELDESKAPKQEEPVVTPEAPAAAEAVTEAPKPATTSKKTSVKKTNTTAKAKDPQPAPAPTVAPAPKKVEPTEVAFASKNLIIPTLARRTPGPSLDKYKEMARQTKMR